MKLKFQFLFTLGILGLFTRPYWPGMLTLLGAYEWMKEDEQKDIIKKRQLDIINKARQNIAHRQDIINKARQNKTHQQNPYQDINKDYLHDELR